MDKDPKIAGILGLLGFLTLNGIGHYYLGNKRKALLLFGLGWGFIVISFIVLTIVFLFINMDLSQSLSGLFQLVFVGYVLVQTFDAYKIAKGEPAIIKF